MLIRGRQFPAFQRKENLADKPDEDRLRDSERRHTTEQVAFLVFENADGGGGSGGDGTDVTGSSSDDTLELGRGIQNASGGDGNDRIIIYGDAGETMHYEPNGEAYRFYPETDQSLVNDVIRGGAGADTFEFRPLINAKPEIIDRHRGWSGNERVHWHGVAGENEAPHDHWVEGIGDDVILDFNKSEGDRIEVNGHTATLRSITYGSDAGGSYSLITIYSQQGNGGNGSDFTAAGAHDEDAMGTIKVYGDRVSRSDVRFDAGVHYGMDQINALDGTPLYEIDPNLFNIARQGHATQSGTLYNAPASRAIDGKVSGNLGSNQMSHTRDEANSWWQVSFAENELDNIQLFNRTEGNLEDYLTNFRVTVYDSAGNVTFTQYHERAGSVLTIDLPDGTKGSRVKVQLEGLNLKGNGILNLSEVRVWAKR